MSRAYYAAFHAVTAVFASRGWSFTKHSALRARNGQKKRARLAPAPFRGTRAEPAHTRIVAEAIASARGVKLEEIAEATTKTAEEFFRFKR